MAIPEILSVGSFLVNVADQLRPSDDLKDAANIIDKSSKAYNAAKGSTIHESINNMVISPLVCVEKDIIHQEYILITTYQLVRQAPIKGMRFISFRRIW